MALSTFGAIMGFAAGIARQTADIYEVMAERANDPGLKEVLLFLQKEDDKTHSFMELTRRENVTEMILEPVAGLQQADYEFDPKILDQTSDEGLLKSAFILEERERKFFHDASSKVPLPEVARIFRKIVRKKEESLSRLQGLGLSETLRRST